MSDVPEIELNALRPGDRIAALHLSPAGDPGSNHEPTPLVIGITGNLLGQGRSRADQAHVTDQHIPQLRDLVETARTQHPSKTRVAGQIRLARVRLSLHRAELDDREFLAMPACSALTKQHWPAEPHAHAERNQ